MDYEQLLNDLVSGKVAEFTVGPSDAFLFQQALRTYEKKKEIVGIAQRNGNITYKLLSTR